MALLYRVRAIKYVAKMLFSLICLLFTVTSVIKPVSADGEPCETAIYGLGVCSDIKACSTIRRELQSMQRSAATDRIKAIYCGNQEICCPPQVSSHTNSHLLTRNLCGVPQDPPHNHQIARVNEFPWMALLIYDSEKRPYQCGGSVITERYVLTTAACVTHELRRVRVGEYRLSTNKDCQSYKDVEHCAPRHQEHAIEKSIRHEFYDSGELTNNIGLVRLSVPIDLTRANVMPICLPLDQSLQAIHLDGQIMTLTGWPLVDTSEKADSLYKINMTVVSNEECESRYRTANLPSYLSGQEMLCAVGTRPYPCRGNSGGPLALAVTLGGRRRHVQCGVASHGAAACNGGPPEVYVRVASYMQWILNNLQA